MFGRRLPEPKPKPMCENEFSYASESFPGFPGTRPGCRNDLLSVGGYNLANFWGIVKFPLQGDNVQNGVGFPAVWDGL